VSIIVLFGALVAGHALCDYPLQGDFLARAKNRAAPLPGVPWYQALGSHAAIHGGAVALITGVPMLGLCEAALHAFIDDLKCTGRIGFNADQALHVVCKAVWAAVAGAVLWSR
jgi:hypothetical protein